MADIDPNAPLAASVPQDWFDDLEQARADVAAGRTCDAREFLRRLQAEDAALAGARRETTP